MQPQALDHVALWVRDRDELAVFCTEYLGMHVVDRTDSFTLVGADARRGKLTLFAADGVRSAGVLKRVVLRVANLDQAVARLGQSTSVAEISDTEVCLTAPEGLSIGLVERPQAAVDYDLDHVRLSVPDPARTVEALSNLGFSQNGAALTVADKFVTVEEGPGDGERPLLNHIALLVTSAQAHIEEAHDRNLEILDVVDAPNTYAVFIAGPDRIRLEYVEHKPTFSLS